jgi:predicted DNA-binding protein
VTVSVYLEPEQAGALKALSERTRVMQAVYLREAVDLLLAKYKAR